jgi:hypothetical protein
LLAAAWSAYRDHRLAAAVFTAISIVLLLIAAFSPRAARSVHDFWTKLSAALGYVNSRILLSILYLAVLAPYGFALRLFGRDPMNRRGPAKSSYWVPRPATRQQKEQFSRLF